MRIPRPARLKTRLQDGSYRQDIANAIADGIEDFLGESVSLDEVKAIETGDSAEAEADAAGETVERFLDLKSIQYKSAKVRLYVPRYMYCTFFPETSCAARRLPPALWTADPLQIASPNRDSPLKRKK